ncbi:MAG TPA: hypothetical protein GX707_17120 [Epulopiscium sp.]|nr:hypothetical protein [Candidatus Epulonipiscium sp.]
MKTNKKKISVYLLILTLLLIPIVLSNNTVSASSANWGSSPGGSFGGTGISGYNKTDLQGARITIVDALSGERKFPTIDVTSQTIPTGTANFGKKTKLDYRKNSALTKQVNFLTHKYSNFPKIVGKNAASLKKLKDFAMKKEFHKNVLIAFTPELKAMGEEAALAELASGRYKILLEPWVINQLNGGKLDTFKPTRGDLARWAPTQLYSWLPRAAYLEESDFGIPVFSNQTKFIGEYTITQKGSNGKYTTKIGKEPLPYNQTVLDMMGIAILSIAPPGPVVTIPKVNLKIKEFDGEYYKNGNYVEIKANAEIDKGFPWQITNDGGKSWSNASMPGPTNHYFYLQWGSDWDNATGVGMGKDYLVEDTNVFNNGEIHHLVDPVTGLKNVKVNLPEIPAGETFFVVRYSVNPTAKAPKFPTSLDPYGRKETTMQDNYAYLLFDVEKIERDLIAVDIVQGITQPTPDWNTINTNITGKTRAVNTKDDESFLKKYPTSPVDMEIFIDGVKREDLSKKYNHELDKEFYSPSLKLSLPNNYQTNPGYNVKIKLTINKNKNTPLNEVTYDNNSIEKEFFIPTIPKSDPIPIIPTPTIPNLKLPWYDNEKYQCYLPRNPKTGQESMVLYDIGTTTHIHKANAVTWIGAPGNEIPEIEATKHLNWGKPEGWKEVKVFGPTCPDEVPNPYQLCLDYVEANQQATGFTWWDTETFQKTRGTEVEKWPTNSIPRLTIRAIQHQSEIACNSTSCCTDGKTELHSHSYETRTGSDENGSYSYSVRVCDGDSPTPHYHWHTDYEVWKKTDVNLTGNIQVFQGSSDTKDHATKKNWTRSGYGIHSKLQYNYKTEIEKGNLCSQCTGDTEAWLFMPHLNKELPHRIVELDKADNNKMFPKTFQTAKNPKAMYSQRKQFIDIDYPDKVMQLNFRYRLLAPGFKPTNYPTATQIDLKNKYPASRPALGNCTGGSIRVEGNMWDDVWVHPDDPNGARR